MSIVGKIKQHFEDYLSEFVYGGLDGSVTTFAVVAGATGARFDVKILLVLGFANLLADGFSMGVGSYLSNKSTHELMLKRGQSIANEPSPVINGVTTYIAFIVVGFVPLLAYVAQIIFDFSTSNLFLVSSILTALAFCGIGLLKSRVAQTRLARAVLETLILGVIAAGFAYVVGDVLERVIT